MMQIVQFYSSSMLSVSGACSYRGDNFCDGDIKGDNSIERSISGDISIVVRSLSRKSTRLDDKLGEELSPLYLCLRLLPLSFGEGTIPFCLLKSSNTGLVNEKVFSTSPVL